MTKGNITVCFNEIAYKLCSSSSSSLGTMFITSLFMMALTLPPFWESASDLVPGLYTESQIDAVLNFMCFHRFIYVHSSYVRCCKHIHKCKKNLYIFFLRTAACEFAHFICWLCFKSTRAQFSKTKIKELSFWMLQNKSPWTFEIK